MFKKTLLVVGILAAPFLIAGSALASVTITNVEVNGKANDTINPGDQITLRVWYNQSNPTDVESGLVSFQGSNLHAQPVDFPDETIAGNNKHVDLTVQGPMEPGYRTPQIKLCGVTGASADQACQVTVVASFNATGQLFVNTPVSTPVPVGTPVPTATPVPGGSNPFPSINWTVACHNPVVAQLFPAQCGVVVLPGTGGGAGDIHIDSTLSYGMMHSAQVSELQSFLIAKGLLHISTPTGNFLNLTLAAVMQYQVQHNISPTGVVGPLTRAAINADAAGMQD